MNAITQTHAETIDPAALRKTLSCFPTGVAVATTRARSGAPLGVTISSFNSVSMSPPLVLWSLARQAASLEEYRAHPGFAINVLAAGQEDLCRRFAGEERDRFAGLEWTEGAMGLPVLRGTAAILECATHAIHEGGDHEILIGRVVAHAETDRTPLVFGKGKLVALDTTSVE